MLRSLYLYVLLALAVVLWPGCEDDDDPMVVCEFDTPQVVYSDPAESCEPELTYLRELGSDASPNIPTLPLDCPVTDANGRTLILDAPSGDDLTLHIYNGTNAYLYLQVFGVTDCESDPQALTDCIIDTRAAFKIPVTAANGYDNLYLRIDYAASSPDEDYERYGATEEDFIAVAAYEQEPEPSRTIEYSRDANNDGAVPEFTPPATLTVSCDGTTFQRIILSSCSPNADVKGWASEIGLPISEQYTGEGGCVVALDVPDGMSVDAVLATSPIHRPQMDTTGLTVEEDFIISLFNPGNLDNFFVGGFEFIQAPSDERIANCLAFNPDSESTESEDQIIVAMVDSGVDGSREEIWDRYRYKQNLTTLFMQGEQLGFDFINNDTDPDDVTPHGTFTAGAVIGGYKAQTPLTLAHFKIFGENNYATYFGALVAIRQSIAIQSDIINLSWGFYADETPLGLQCLIEAASEAGIIVTTSAGNEGNPLVPGNLQWPAAFAATYPETVVTTGSYFYQDNEIDAGNVDRSNFSNYGLPYVSVAAFMTTGTPGYNDPKTVVYVQGTSISTPIVTRTLANIIGSRGGGSVSELESFYDQAPMLSGETVNDFYLPVCSDGLEKTFRR